MKNILNILYLEDDRLDIELVLETLNREGIGCRLISVDKAKDFTAVLMDSSIDLILADYSLPSFNGISAFEIAQKLHPEIPFIFVSGKIGEDLAAETIKRGASDYILKQHLNYLVPALRRALREAQERQKRMAAEDALLKSEERFRTLVETTTDWVWETDINGVFTYASPKVMDILGYDQEEIIGKTWFDFIPDNEKERASALLKRINKEQSAFRGMELDHSHRNGKRITIEINGMPIVDEDGNHSGWRGFNRDVTERKLGELELKRARDELERHVEERTVEMVKAIEKLAQEVEMRKRAEKALRESRERYRDLVETIGDVIWEVNTEGIYTYVSPRARDILGHGSEELIGKTFFEHMSPEEAERTYDLIRAQRKETKEIDLIEIKKIHEDGSVVFLESGGKPFFYRNGRLRGYRGSYRNVTERKRIEAAMQKSKAELRHLSSQLLEAHERESKRIGAELHDGIAQTVSAIKMRAEVAFMQLGNKDASEVGKSLESIIAIAQEAVEEIRRVSRNLRPSMLDNLGIIPTVSWLCRDFENTYPHISINDQIDMQEEDVPDPLKTVVFRILQESLNNTAKHSRASFVSLSMIRADGRINVTVKDDGEGFDVEDVLKRDHLNRGLGLASMKERAELSNGTFSIESCEEAGTTVRASWPAK
jgi:PAS domain S-box-containing protein